MGSKSVNVSAGRPEGSYSSHSEKYTRAPALGCYDKTKSEAELKVT